MPEENKLVALEGKELEKLKKKMAGLGAQTVEDAAARQVVVLQPRRIAARAAARRIAFERAGVLGEEVGYQVRFDRKASARTRILVVTEGILTRRIQSDPFLDGVGAVVLESVLAHRALDFFVVMSSLSTVLGGLAMGAYSAANLFIDGLAVARAQAGGPGWTGAPGPCASFRS